MADQARYGDHQSLMRACVMSGCVPEVKRCSPSSVLRNDDVDCDDCAAYKLYSCACRVCVNLLHNLSANLDLHLSRNPQVMNQNVIRQSPVRRPSSFAGFCKSTAGKISSLSWLEEFNNFIQTLFIIMLAMLNERDGRSQSPGVIVNLLTTTNERYAAGY